MGINIKKFRKKGRRLGISGINCKFVKFKEVMKVLLIPINRSINQKHKKEQI